jgi:energy-coupling factor transporter ATP-binding protein EcfA2
MDAIRCAGLSKRFGPTVAVDGLDLQVSPGQVYGFLGPNGAGKTTTIRMLLGLIGPSAGRAWLLGHPLPDPRVVAETGSMIEEPGAVARGQLAATAVAAGSMLVALLVAGIASVGTWSPAAFIQAWMGFGSGGYLPANFWSRFTGSGAPYGELAGLIGIVVTAIVAAGIARWRFAADVTL